MQKVGPARSAAVVACSQCGLSCLSASCVRPQRLLRAKHSVRPSRSHAVIEFARGEVPGTSSGARRRGPRTLVFAPRYETCGAILVRFDIYSCLYFSFRLFYAQRLRSVAHTQQAPRVIEAAARQTTADNQKY
eukprot:6214842-Pleurochrysis_carterae.AAC.5